MTSLDLDHFRAALEAERKRVTDALQYLHSETPNPDGEETQEGRMEDHLADSAAVTYDREMDFSLEENSEQVLDEIDRALKRIENGSYGKCANCGKDIPAERLEAIPYAEYCIDCARERGG
jgi:RNA polymerase-binding protein DksA